eukprot:Em0020g588a
MSGLTFFLVLVTLAIGTLHVETASPISEVVVKVSKVFENRERQTRRNCATVTAIINGDLSQLSQQCTNAFQMNIHDPINGAMCTSACNDLYQAQVRCNGAAATRYAYRMVCKNGYQGLA